ncbi:hypothetical protein CALVIDRAFT_534248 [Calocera viscosa TUFC12733]|uniref:Uncharacterized protein n=1 Tax=Calocera viscosa (strain TUFC12733) TaxID=1330018 RepID=A0A167QJK6_CALVF|nr:hypothetical protein CALVIDRAFT_534248 [Calocera viscosa TUFC12733]
MCGDGWLPGPIWNASFWDTELGVAPTIRASHFAIDSGTSDSPFSHTSSISQSALRWFTTPQPVPTATSTMGGSW